MKFTPALTAFLILLAGCDSIDKTFHPDTRQMTQPERRRVLDERSAADEQRHAGEDLRNRFKRYSTGELHLMRSRYADLTGKTTSVDAGINPGASQIWGNADRKNTEKLIDIERELLRRWKLGDEDAHLPQFYHPFKGQ